MEGKNGMNRTYKEITIFVNPTATQEINSIQRTSYIQISEYILLHILLRFHNIKRQCSLDCIMHIT